MTKLNDLYAEMISSSGTKVVYSDFEIVQAIYNNSTSLEEESKLKKIDATINTLANSIVLIDVLENSNDDNNMTPYIIRAIHESMCCDIFILVGIGMWFFQKYTNIKVVDPHETTNYLETKYKLTKDEKIYFQLLFYDNIQIILDSFMFHRNTLRTFGGNGETVRFQVTDKELNSILLVDGIMNEQQLIASNMYFSNMLLIILKYLELIFKYSSIDHYKIKNFSVEVLKYRQENNMLGKSEVIHIDNIKRLRKIYDQLINSDI